MYHELPLIIELVLFNGFKEEAEKIFCLSDELSKDQQLAYNMVRLTEIGLICRCASNGDYNTVKNLIELYKSQKLLNDMSNVFYTLHCNQIMGPMFYSLYEEHVDIYKLLRDNKDVFSGRMAYEDTLPELLGEIVGHTGYEATMVVLDEVTHEMCSSSDIKNITDGLEDAYWSWFEDTMENGDIISKNYWGDELYHVAIKLKIEPDKYMVVSPVYRKNCDCAYKWSSDKHCIDLDEKIAKFHIDNYERIKKSIQQQEQSF